MGLRERGARLREQSGVLGRWSTALERARQDVRRAEQDSTALGRRIAARVVRLFYELLVLVLIAIGELDTVRRRAAHALVSPRKR